MAKSGRSLRKSSVTPVQSWWPRFWAWVIDVIILGIIVAMIYPPAFFFNNWQGGAMFDVWRNIVSGLLSLIYWTVLDSGGMQSIGKKVLGLRQVTVNGGNVNIVKSAISAFGKAFLLPLDFLIGVLARPGKKQRLFNIVSDTVVVKTK